MLDKITEHKPILAYKKRKAIFLDIEFYIDQRVYVPNPETELMVQYAINYIKSNQLSNGTFIDVGTGCGNIAITLAKNFPNAKIIATDISDDAIDVAKINVEFHKIKNIEFVKTNLILDVINEPDLVIGNLPWGDDDHLLQTNTKEALALMPPVAIFAPDGIIGTYVRLCNQIQSKGWNTILIAETGILDKEIIVENMPNNFNWEYEVLPNDIFNYSITKVFFNNKVDTKIVHHHLIYQTKVDRNDLDENAAKQLIQFLDDLVSEIDMHILISPQVAYSYQKAWTGLVGIVTSHISFHYWTEQNYLQLDIYSCKRFDIRKTIEFLDDFWKSKEKKILFIEREMDSDFKLTRF